MACADITVIQRVQEKTDIEEQVTPLIQYYQPEGQLATAKTPLQTLLQNQPAWLGSAQMVNGLFSVAVEIVLAITVSMSESLYVLLRISFLTGPFFFGAGLVTNLLCKYPGLLPVSYFLHWASVAMATLEVVIISVDLSGWDQVSNKKHLMLELVEMCVMVLNLFMSLVLCVCIRSKINIRKGTTGVLEVQHHRQ